MNKRLTRGTIGGGEVLDSFGDFLKRKRLERGLTQTDVQKFLNLASNGVVSHWEKERSYMSDENARSIARLYGIKEDDLLYRLFCAKKLIPTVRKWTKEYKDCAPVLRFIRKCVPDSILRSDS